MALKDRALVLPKFCKAERLIGVLTKEDRGTLESWVHDKVPARSISRALGEEYPEHRVAKDTLVTHLQGDCVCPEGSALKGAW